MAVPRFEDNGEILRFLKQRIFLDTSLTAGVFPFRREGEDPARMFAGEVILRGLTDVLRNSLSIRKRSDFQQLSTV